MPIPPLKPGKGKPLRFNLMWMYAIIFLILGGLYMLEDNSVSKSVDYSTFQRYIAQDRGITKIIVYTDKKEAEGFLTDSLARVVFGDRAQSPDVNVVAKVVTDIPSADKLDTQIDQWRASGAFNGSVKYERSSMLGSFLWSIAPIAILIVAWIWIMRRMNGGAGSGAGGGVFSVGKSKAMLFDKNNADKVTFKDVAGLSEAKTEIEEIVEFLKNPKRYTDLGGKIPKGALLVGPPGTGKTLLAKAVAGEANVPFFSMSGSDFVEMFVGVGASRVRDLFRQAKEKAPCIVFIDEIDAVGRARGRNANMGSNDERENTLNQLLTEMDGFGSNSGVIILAATNRADILDKALMRAGRFDRQIYVDLPDLPDRVAIFKVHLRNIKIDGDLDIELLARQTPGFSGADIANVCNEAALIAARHNKPAVTREDFSAAVDRIIGGIEKRSKITTDEEKRSIAIHEAGHATVSWHLRYANPLVKVTIVPRGKALGAAWYLPEERQITPSQVILDEICATLGGRAAEEVFLGRISTGAANDLERVTKQAYAMVVYYGMSDKLPNLSYYDSTGQDYGFTKPFSDERARIIDDEVSRIIAEQYERAKELLRRHADGHHRLTEVLINREVIFTQDVVDIFGERPWKSRTDEILAHDPRLLEAPKADETGETATAPATDAPDAPEAQAADDGTDTPSETPDNTPTPPPYTGA
ncbi:MAG: ATP-dependent zinc metalloprotease FtsH [Bacteroides sp.]|nr:ATP-dependent zinc metalloprotease FtsH [Bacteroides sp.]MCM1094827.1 ATP-dependent zinc metalloprotease FtsH [Terasakiella sp.]